MQFVQQMSAQQMDADDLTSGYLLQASATVQCNVTIQPNSIHPDAI